MACVRNGQSIGSCVKEFGIPDSSLRKICHDRNVSYPRQNRGIPKEKKLIMAKQAAEKVMGGQSINKTAREFGVDPKTMRTWLEKLNIRSRERTKAKSYNEDDVQKALEELKRSCSLVSLSRKYNVPCSVLKRRRDKLLQDPAKEKGQKQANPASPIIINSTKDEWVNHAFKLGTVVWAKLVGFPWWPGIIAIDPDVQNFYRNLEFSTRTPVWYMESSLHFDFLYLFFVNSSGITSFSLPRRESRAPGSGRQTSRALTFGPLTRYPCPSRWMVFGTRPSNKLS